MAVNKLIFWDIDGTLMHCGSDGRTALNRAFFRLYGITDAFSKVTIGGALDSNIIINIMRNFNIDSEDYFKIVDQYHKELIEVLKNNKTKRILPGVLSLLDTIKQDPTSVNALLTSNLRIGAEAKLDSVGLDGYFKLGGYGDKLGEKWDAGETCIKTIECIYQTDFTKDRIFLIGDSTYDVFCAHKLGINSIAVTTGWSDQKALLDSKPTHLFLDLSDTNQILEILGVNGK